MFLLVLAVAVLILAAENGLVMMFIGNLHHDISTSIPALGWETTLWMMMPLYILEIVFGGLAAKS